MRSGDDACAAVMTRAVVTTRAVMTTVVTSRAVATHADWSIPEWSIPEWSMPRRWRRWMLERPTVPEKDLRRGGQLSYVRAELKEWQHHSTRGGGEVGRRREIARCRAVATVRGGPGGGDARRRRGGVVERTRGGDARSGDARSGDARVATRGWYAWARPAHTGAPDLSQPILMAKQRREAKPPVEPLCTCVVHEYLKCELIAHASDEGAPQA